MLHHQSTESLIDFGRFPTWSRLHRATAYVLRFIHNIRKNGTRFTGHLQQPELKNARETVLKLVQRESFPDEIAALKNKEGRSNRQRAIGKRSPLYKLMPVMDERGLLRERGRIEAATGVPYDMRHPIILPRKHHVTELLVLWYHRLYHHGNNETVVNELRQVYNIPKLRMVVKMVSKNCPLCTIRRSLPRNPPMAPLPPARLAHHERAFTYTGLDYFGPLLVKLGRSNVKRWVALFTL